MPNRNPLLAYLDKLTLKRCGDERPAGLYLASVPVPRGAPPRLTLGGHCTYCQPLGQWPGAPAPAPRRLLLVADGGPAPAELAVSAGEAPTHGTPPETTMRLVEESEDFYLAWESHAVRIVWGGRAVELIMGLRTQNTVHWWEAARLIVREETPDCRVIEAGGVTSVNRMTKKVIDEHPDFFSNPFLHKHNWLNGHIYARLYANGVCEVYAHHINSKFFDDGLPLHDAVPVIGLRTDNPGDLADVPAVWDGSKPVFHLGEVELDLTSAVHLVTPEKPGNFTREKDFLIWQPYQGVELYAGPPAAARTGNEYVCRAEDRVIPRGVARTVRFSFSLSPERPARVARYLAPAWWYGLCEEFMPQPLLPISNEFDDTLQAATDWHRNWSTHGGFEDGDVARWHKPTKAGRFEPGWEGETPYAHLLYAWRSGDAEQYDRALRSCYFFTDVCVDHAANMVRMHGYPPNAFALPMARVQACIGAWLETGDPYPLDTAQAVIETAYRLHKNSWPRMAVGRDACFTRGAIMLYRYLNKEHYLAVARDALADTIAAQNPDGSFGIQGGGDGIHQIGGHVISPWCCLMAVGGMLDYLELFPDDQLLLNSVQRFGEWMMSERFEINGVMGWSDTHTFRNGRTMRNFKGQIINLPAAKLWHTEYLARFLFFCALRFRRRNYFEAWEASYRAHANKIGWDHGYCQVMQFIPWLQAMLWRVTLTENGLKSAPVWLGPKTPPTGEVLAPQGKVRLAWNGDGQPTASPKDKVTFTPVRI